MQCTDQTYLSLLLLRHFSENGTRRSYAIDEVLFNEGDLSDALYVLIFGKLKVYATNSSAREIVLSTLKSGDVFGEMFLDGEPRSASVKAIEPSQCLIVHEPELRDLMRTHPHVAECVVMQLISRLRHATRKLKGLALDGVYERVTAVLQEAAVEDASGRRIPRHLTQLEIAHHVGASREMVNHVLRDLIRGGFILKDHKHQMTLVKPLPKHW